MLASSNNSWFFSSIFVADNFRFTMNVILRCAIASCYLLTIPTVLSAQTAKTKSQVTKKAKVTPQVVKKGQAKPATANKNGDMAIVEAFTQRMVPGTLPQDAPPMPAGTYVVIKWLSSAYPETFFWRAEKGFFPCKVEKVRKIPPADGKVAPKGMEYMGAEIANDKIAAGDTLMLTPLLGGKFPIPPDVPQTAQNTVFYRKFGVDAWLYLAVGSIAKKSDIAMP
jgi:hypothetical protein